MMCKKFRQVTVVVCLIFSIVFTGCEKKKTVSYSSADESDIISVTSLEQGSETVSGTTLEESVNVAERNINQNESYYVQLTGAVNNPGVYKFDEQLRLFEAINQVGGLREDACIDGINLSIPIEDEILVRIPTMEEWNEKRLSGEIAYNSGGNSDVNNQSGTDTQKININTAGRQELMNLPGIGEAKAQAIMDYRNENGGFSDISDIMKISGIKESVYNKLKDLIVAE